MKNIRGNAQFEYLGFRRTKTPDNIIYCLKCNLTLAQRTSVLECSILRLDAIHH